MMPENGVNTHGLQKRRDSNDCKLEAYDRGGNDPYGCHALSASEPSRAPMAGECKAGT